jgi:Predicted redox protein, regulator of disulfide bond formation
MMNEPSAAAVVDARGMRCPWPALRLARAMRAEHMVLLLADDPQAAREIAALAALQGLDGRDRERGVLAGHPLTRSGTWCRQASLL